MSGCSYESKCPNCNNNVSVYEDHKPFQVAYVGPCVYFVFVTITKVVYQELKSINILREDFKDDNGYEAVDLDYLEQLTELQ